MVRFFAFDARASVCQILLLGPLPRQCEGEGDVDRGRKGREPLQDSESLSAIKIKFWLRAEKEENLSRIQKVSRRNIGISAKEDLSSMVQNRPRWSAVLNALTRSLPPKVWLDSVNVVKDADGNNMLRINGHAKTQSSLRSMILQLESHEMFTGTSLISSNLSPDGSGNIRYEIDTYPTRVDY